jgi:hypothetical protein
MVKRGLIFVVALIICIGCAQADDLTIDRHCTCKINENGFSTCDILSLMDVTHSNFRDFKARSLVRIECASMNTKDDFCKIFDLRVSLNSHLSKEAFSSFTRMYKIDKVSTEKGTLLFNLSGFKTWKAKLRFNNLSNLVTLEEQVGPNSLLYTSRCN